MKKFHFLILFIILILGLVINYNFGHNEVNRNQGKDNQEITGKYKYNLAVLNKSFKRDLERSVIAYISFEKHFLNAEKTPFVIVIPLKDWDLFIRRFQEAKDSHEIKRLPIFLTEQEVFKACEEPDLSYHGNLAQQVIKLCFGTTRIAKNYIMMDSDNYFTKDFDPKILFENNILRTFSWKIPENYIENNKKLEIPWFNDGGLSPEVLDALYKTGATYSAHNLMMLIKDFFGNKNQEVYGFVMAPSVFNSDALDRMKKFTTTKGFNKFAMLIRLVPFEMQWYGEYMLQHEKFILIEAIFSIINSPDECYYEHINNDYGICFQSVVYNYTDLTKSTGAHNQLTYKRPAYCDK